MKLISKTRIYRKIILAILLMPNLIFGAGIPTIDVAAIAQSVLNYTATLSEFAKTATRWQETISHYKSQLQSYEKQLNATKGIKNSISTLRDLKSIYSNFGRAYSNIRDFKNQVLSDPMSFVKNELKDTYAKYTLYDRCDNIEDVEEKAMCLVDFTITAFESQSIDETMGDLEKLNQSIAELDQKLRNSDDIKESQDIHNAIASEALKLQMMQTKLDIENRQYEKQKALNEERKKQLFSKSVNNFNYDTMSALGLK